MFGVLDAVTLVERDCAIEVDEQENVVPSPTADRRPFGVKVLDPSVAASSVELWIDTDCLVSISVPGPVLQSA